MAIIEFKSSNQNVAYCLVDCTNQYTSAWTRELMKNQADYTIANIVDKGFTVLQGYDEDQLLRRASELNFKHAVVFNTGTEFVNGNSFFNEIENMINKQYFIAGHILDRKDAYYELHDQCFVINLTEYANLNYPLIGKQELGARHEQYAPMRSIDNIHDDHTPTAVVTGFTKAAYNHKCHGWNILSIAFDKDLPVIVFDNKIRDNKKHYYPENQTEFLKHSVWLYARQNYCSETFVHTESTDRANSKLVDVEQVFTPASGIWWVDCISKTKPVEVVMYDYNQKSLDYWKEHAPVFDNVVYKFVKVDLLVDDPTYISFDANKCTLINLSNIFAYEATTPFYSLEYRLNKENKLLEHINSMMPDANVSFSTRAVSGLANVPLYGKNLQPISISEVTRPTWHYGDWL